MGYSFSLQQYPIALIDQKNHESQRNAVESCLEGLFHLNLIPIDALSVSGT